MRHAKGLENEAIQIAEKKDRDIRRRLLRAWIALRRLLCHQTHIKGAGGNGTHRRDKWSGYEQWDESPYHSKQPEFHPNYPMVVVDITVTVYCEGFEYAVRVSHKSDKVEKCDMSSVDRTPTWC